MCVQSWVAGDGAAHALPPPRRRRAATGVEEDQEKAIELWRLLHDRDLSDDASYSYAMCLVQGGTSAPHDPERGLQTLHLLASRKFAYACHALGFMYEAGEGVEQDVAKAKEMYSVGVAGPARERPSSRLTDHVHPSRRRLRAACPRRAA